MRSSDFVLWLAKSRAESLLHHSEEPPRCLAMLLHADPAVAGAAQERTVREWRALLRAEALQRDGSWAERTSPLRHVMWRHNRWLRLVHCLVEAGDVDSARRHIVHMFQGFGDSKVIEDIHQHLRDLDRAQRHKTTW